MAKGTCYIFTGPEIGEKQEAIDAIRSLVTNSSGTKPEEHSYYAGESDIASILSDIQNGSLFCDNRIFIIKAAEEIKKKDETKQFADTIKHLPDDTILILVSDSNNIDKSLESACPKENKKIFWELFENRKSDWIRKFLGKAGFKVQDEGIEAILELVEGNTDSLRRELSRFDQYFEKGSTLNAADIEKVLSHTREESPFTLFSAIAERDTSRALSILHNLLASKEAPVQVLAGLSWCYKRLQDYLAIKEDGRMNDFELKKVGITTKKAQADYQAAGRYQDSKRCKENIRLLSDTDIQLRSNSGPLEKIRMEVLLLKLMSPNS